LGRRGKRANNATAEEVREAIMSILRTQYVDLGPTLVGGEKLAERHQYSVSVSKGTFPLWLKGDIRALG